MDKEGPQHPSDITALQRILHFFGIGRPDTAEELEQELQELIEEGEEQGLLTSQEGLMISSILDLRDTAASEIMTPRPEMICAPATATVRDVIRLIAEQGFTRVPIYAENPDHIIGIIHAKDLLVGRNRDDQPAADFAKPATFVNDTEKVADLLRSFQANKTHLAIVTDEFGVTRGLITLEDILEEIVGEIADEHDEPEALWRGLDKNTLVANARVGIEEVEKFFAVKLPEGPYESVGGLVIHQLGQVPRTGAVVTVGELTFHVVLATKRRIVTVKITRGKPSAETA